MMNSKLVVAAIAALGLTASQAYAQDEGGDEEGGVEGGVEVGGEVGDDGAEAGVSADASVNTGDTTVEGDGEMADTVGQGLTVPVGKISVFVDVGVNLGEEAIAKPLTIAPDIFYGVSNKLDVGLGHSGRAITGFWGDTSQAGGLCLTGEDSGCAKLYDGPTGLLAHFGLAEGNVTLAADAGVIIRQLSDPMMLGIKAGVLGRYMAGKIAVGFNPNIYIGVTERDFNKEQLNIPVDVMFMASDKLGVGVQTGIRGPLDGFGDAYSIPLSLAAMFQANDNLGVGAAFSLLRVAGFEGPGAADIRGLNIFVSWHN